MSGEGGFAPWLARWQLAVDGQPFDSRNGHLLPVRWRGQAALLKLSHHPEEQAGGRLMAWWSGDGAAPVLAIDGPALLLARADGDRSLGVLALDGHDDEATRLLCTVAARLHAPRRASVPPLMTLARWFEPLTSVAHDGTLALAARVARALLEAPCDPVVLHGDLHHGNVLHFGPAGWLAIDPKALHGERGFDFANLLCNPDPALAAEPARFARRVAIVSESAALDRDRLLAGCSRGAGCRRCGSWRTASRRTACSRWRGWRRQA